MTETLKTPRLTLRPLHQQDAPAFVRHLSSWEVMQWLSGAPWPYGLADAEWFIGQAFPDHWAIEAGQGLIGVISFDPTLGYWLCAENHGQGLMSEAVTAVLKHHFTKCDDTVVSGHMPGNAPSRAVLLKHGFRDTQVEKLFSRPLGRDTDIQRMELTAIRWRSLRSAQE